MNFIHSNDVFIQGHHAAYSYQSPFMADIEEICPASSAKLAAKTHFGASKLMYKNGTTSTALKYPFLYF